MPAEAPSGLYVYIYIYIHLYIYTYIYIVHVMPAEAPSGLCCISISRAPAHVHSLTCIHMNIYM